MLLLILAIKFKMSIFSYIFDCIKIEYFHIFVLIWCLNVDVYIELFHSMALSYEMTIKLNDDDNDELIFETDFRMDMTCSCGKGILLEVWSTFL